MGLCSPEQDSDSGMTWASDTQSDILAAKWHGLVKPGAGLWQQHSVGWYSPVQDSVGSMVWSGEALSRTLATTWQFPEEVSIKVNRGEPEDMLALDIQKVFDKVAHNRVKHKEIEHLQYGVHCIEKHHHSPLLILGMAWKFNATLIFTASD
eukprot:g45690.t1